MINYREIFNTTYGYLVLLLIILILCIIFLFNKDKKYNFNLFSKIFFISGIILLVVDMILNFVINNFFSYDYKLFINVIGNSIYSNLLYYSVISIIIGVIFYIVGMFWNKRLAN